MLAFAASPFSGVEILVQGAGSDVAVLATGRIYDAASTPCVIPLQPKSSLAIDIESKVRVYYQIKLSVNRLFERLDLESVLAHCCTVMR